ncbi:MAG: substrate-binding domain-containing protein [Acutalibacteraceae bacterium]|nr:substrate-binding domain-containing protein [Acutalibacteraceae bacterium]
MRLKRLLFAALAMITATALLTGCTKVNREFTTESAITVISREDGSGTRSAFTQLTGVYEETATTKTDNTVAAAIIQSNTQAVITGVAGDLSAIGYISLGSLNDSVTAVKINGVAPTADTIRDGTYKIARPFNIAVKSDLSTEAKNFVDFILSTEGQRIVADAGYVEAVDNPKEFAGVKGEGTVKVGGSSSVSPVMEKLAEEYEKLNQNVNVEVSASDSSTGMSAAAEGTLDIGLASRAIKPSETEKGLTATAIAKDGIAVIINHKNTVNDITLEQLKNIYTGEYITWKLG